jgi:hypothetical protein
VSNEQWFDIFQTKNPERFVLALDRCVVSNTDAVCLEATTISAATATTTISASTAPAPAARVLARTSFVDGQRATIMLGVVEIVDRVLCVLGIFHFDKSKTFAATGVAILDHLGAANRPKLGKQLLERFIGNSVGQVPYIQLRSHIKYSCIEMLPNPQSSLSGPDGKEPNKEGSPRGHTNQAAAGKNQSTDQTSLHLPSEG